MINEKIRAALVFVIIFAIVGGVSWALVNAQQPPKQQDQPQTPPKLSTQEDIRDAAIVYIAVNHPETTQFMNNLSWIGGREETGLLGAETYTYESDSWTVTMHYPVVLNPIYSVNVTYVSQGSQIAPQQIAIDWQGTWQNGTVIEKSYIFNP